MSVRERITRSDTQRIEAPPDVVFPLICPVREADWLDGWADSFELIHSASGLAETGCVFRTFGHGEPDTIWTITEHDPAGGVVEFVRVTAGLVATTLRVVVEDNGDGTSAVHVTYLHTPVSDEGARWAATRYESGTFVQAMRWWETSMNHYLRTGECLREPEPSRAEARRFVEPSRRSRPV